MSLDTLRFLPVITYSSLGNRFLLYDLRDSTRDDIARMLHDPGLTPLAQELCSTYATDGVLLAWRTQDNHGTFCVEVVNADGSNGGLCLNGIRCVAHYLFTQGLESPLTVRMGDKSIVYRTNSAHTPHTISLTLPGGHYAGKREIRIDDTQYSGAIVDVGNPHFMIFEQKSIDWLKAHGSFFENNPLFPHRTNTEFVWQSDAHTYNMLVYERGCGITAACSSACVALITVLAAEKKIANGEAITIIMSGGSLRGWIEGASVTLEAEMPITP